MGVYVCVWACMCVGMCVCMCVCVCVCACVCVVLCFVKATSMMPTVKQLFIMIFVSFCFIISLQRRSSYDTEALPIQLDNKDVNLHLDFSKVAERNCRKVYDKINVSSYWSDVVLFCCLFGSQQNNSFLI